MANKDKKENGLLVYVQEGSELPDVFPTIVPFECEFGKQLEEVERLAEGLGLKEGSWDFCEDNEDRYLVLANWRELEVWTSNNYFIYQDDYYIYDMVKKRWTDDFTWEKRDEAVADSEDAMFLLSIRMTEGFGQFDEKELEEMEAFSKKWKVPFSAELFGRFDNMFNEQYPYWNSSSAQC